MYHNAKELLEAARAKGARMYQIVLENQMRLTEKTSDEVYAQLRQRLAVMRAGAGKMLDDPAASTGTLIRGNAHKQNQYAQGRTVCGEAINKVMAMALSCSEVNASMGLICAAPTAGACGILPAVLLGVASWLEADEQAVLDALLLASGIGAIVTQNATVAGAVAGCQAECGVAAAMAAAATVQLYGGTDEQALDAAAFTLINVMGLVCDPVAGLVQFPCAQRNASQAVNALICADMAMAGMKNIIPFDEVVEAMYKTGRMLPPQLRETALGGVAATASGRAAAKEIFGTVPSVHME